MVIEVPDEHLIVTRSLIICEFLCACVFVCALHCLAECSVKHGDGSTRLLLQVN